MHFLLENFPPFDDVVASVFAFLHGLNNKSLSCTFLRFVKWGTEASTKHIAGDEGICGSHLQLILRRVASLELGG